MKVYVLGNPLVKKDKVAFKVMEILKKKMREVSFFEFDPIEDIEEKNPVFIDTVENLDRVREIGLDELEIKKRYSLHDFGLEHLLTILKKLGKINKVRIIGIPSNYDPNKAAKEVEVILKSILTSEND